MAEHGEQKSPQIPQRILVLRDFCIRSANVACTRCVDVCPACAVSIAGDTVTVDAGSCTLCGICQGACDAFTSSGIKVGDIDAAVMRIALAEPGREVIVTCDRNVAEGGAPASNVVSAPCLAMVPAELWAKFLARDVNISVAIDLAACGECPACAQTASKGADGDGEADDAHPGQSADNIYAEAIAQAESWSGKQVGFSESVPAAADEGLFASLAQAGREGGRRGALSDIFASLKDASSGELRKRTDPRLRSFIEQNERTHSRAKLNLGNGQEFNRFTPTGRARTIMHPSRQMLLNAIEADPDMAERVQLSIAQTSPDACAGDLRCTRACPTGARRPDAQTGKLAFESRLCVGCGACAKVCRHDAIAIESVTADTLAC